MRRHQLLLVWFPKEFRSTYEADIIEILNRETSVGRRSFDALDLLWGAMRMQVRVTVRNGATRLWRLQRFSAAFAVIITATIVVAAPLTMVDRRASYVVTKGPLSQAPASCLVVHQSSDTTSTLLRCYR